MKLDRRTWLASALGSVGVAACGPRPMPSSLAHPLRGHQAPAIEAISTSEEPIKVPPSGLSTRVSVVEFWAPWCGSCMAALPGYADMHNDRRSHGLSMVGIALDTSRGDAELALTWAGASFPLVLDPKGDVAKAYRVSRIPLAFVIDPYGRIAWVGRNPDHVATVVDSLLA